MDPLTIRDRLDKGADGGRCLWGVGASISLDALRDGSCLDATTRHLAGKSVLIATRDPLAAALALIELDGVASRLVIATPDVKPEHLPRIVANARVELIVSDEAPRPGEDGLGRVQCTFEVSPRRKAARDARATEWVLLTSGTTGVPKLVVHTLATLTAPLATPSAAPLEKGDTHTYEGLRKCECPPFSGAPSGAAVMDVVWGTFYDIRRYGGMQILLRALLGRGSFVISGAPEPAGDYLARLAAHGATHVSGTATHWRRALMTPAARDIAPRYVRLSGEIADQGILNNLRAFYPDAKVGHAFASTEAGVAFEVNDGLAGFPGSVVGTRGDVEIRVEQDSIRIRSPRMALGYLDDVRRPVTDADGFVDTGDIVERRDGRYHFLGRRTGVINVGGLKVYPEEVEAAINRHPAVRMSLVRPHRNPIMGALVAADVVVKDKPSAEADRASAALRQEILQICRDTLAPHKIPAVLRFVPALDVAAAGKLARRDV